MQPRFDIADVMVREMRGDLEKLGLPQNLTVSEYFCGSCGGVVVISSTTFSGEREFECSDCGLTQYLKTCHLRVTQVPFDVQEVKVFDVPQSTEPQNR